MALRKAQSGCNYLIPIGGRAVNLLCPVYLFYLKLNILGFEALKPGNLKTSVLAFQSAGSRLIINKTIFVAPNEFDYQTTNQFVLIAMTCFSTFGLIQIIAGIKSST